MSEMMGDFDFADMRNQVYRREMNSTYEFNLMLVGSTGIGKSSLVKSLFRGKIKPGENSQPPKLNEYTELLEENGVKLRLCCIETSNFDCLDSKSTNIFVKYIDQQLESYFRSQVRLPAWKIKDTRVHCCLYFISPIGKMKLRQEDIDCMRAIHEKVNLIPIIPGADRIDSIQLEKFKENILADLNNNNIKYFKFQYDSKEDEDRSIIVKSLADRFPFAVVAADEPTVEHGHCQWIRQTVGGPINIDDSSKCDFDALSRLLIRHCMLNLIDSTHDRHYAKFKTDIIEGAQGQRGENFRSMGLKDDEIKRVLHCTS